MEKTNISKNKFLHLETCAKYMRERAKDYGLDPDEMYMLGMVHDIGYINGKIGHEESGACILDKFGARKENIFAVKHHGSNAYIVEKLTDDVPREYVLLLEADLSVNQTGEIVGFKKRLEEIKKMYDDATPAEKSIQFVKEYWDKNGIMPV